jgi:hypothetical protein
MRATLDSEHRTAAWCQCHEKLTPKAVEVVSATRKSPTATSVSENERVPHSGSLKTMEEISSPEKALSYSVWAMHAQRKNMCFQLMGSVSQALAVHRQFVNEEGGTADSEFESGEPNVCCKVKSLCAD